MCLSKTVQCTTIVYIEVKCFASHGHNISQNNNKMLSVTAALNLVGQLI